MSPFPLGILASAGGVAGSFDLLESQMLTSPQASITFSNLNTSYASNYKHLQIRMVARASRPSSTTDPVIMKLNGNTQTRAHVLYANGSSVNSYSEATAYSLWDAITGTTAATDAFGTVVIDILDAFETTKNKTVRVLTAANTVVTLGSVFWDSTATTSSINLSAFSATNFLSGSRFSLYGIKG